MHIVLEDTADIVRIVRREGFDNFSQQSAESSVLPTLKAHKPDVNKEFCAEHFFKAIQPGRKRK